MRIIYPAGIVLFRPGSLLLVQTQENRTGRVSAASDRGFSNEMWAGTVVMEISIFQSFPASIVLFTRLHLYRLWVGSVQKEGFLLLLCLNVTLT